MFFIAGFVTGWLCGKALYDGNFGLAAVYGVICFVAYYIHSVLERD